MRRNPLRTDRRAVEGMPIRLVIAVTVGAAAMSLLVPMLDSVEQVEQTEVTVEPDRRQIVLDSDTAMQNVTIAVVSVDGEPIPDSTVIFSERSLLLPHDPHAFETGANSHEVTVSIGESTAADVPVAYRTTQRRGTIQLDVRPPGGREFTSRSDQPELTVSHHG